MDTPDRKQIATPVSKFEDSPVFNYINSLSPIQPVKSVHIGQTFNSLTFSSPPSVFTSPHVSSHRESRFLRRNFFSSSVKSDLSSVDGVDQNASETVLDAIQVLDCSADITGSIDNEVSVREVLADKKSDNSELAIELPRTLKFDCGSPECKADSSNSTKTDSMLVKSEVPATLDQYGGEVSIERIDAICQVEQDKEEEIGCDWENLMTDASELLIFNSSNNIDTEHQGTVEFANTTYSSVALPEGNTNDMRSTQPLDLIDFCENHVMDNTSAQVAAGEQAETNHTPDIISSTLLNKMHVNFPPEMTDDKAEGHISFDCKQRGIRRRCLVFEAAGARKRKLDDDSNSSSSVSSKSDEKYASLDKHPLPMRPCTSSSPCMIPGIGLHLNALAITTKDSGVVKNETLASGNELINMPSSVSSVHSISSEQKIISNSMSLKSIADINPVGNDLQSMVDASRASAFRKSEDFNENSPKKKRRRSDHGGESEACKRCNCKKSKCLKLYCECFAAGVYCVEPCSCQECFNKPLHEDTVLATRKQIESRNPLAFAPKVIRNSDSAPEIGEDFNKTPASARHKRGCNCKKSSCLKKYCECYQGGVGCSINCRCENCKNTFGVKDGSTSVGSGEAEPAEEEPETGDKDALVNSLHNIDTQKDVERCPELVLPLSFSFQICRTSIQLPFSSYARPPRSSLASQSKFEKHFQVIPEDETPEILRGNFSPIRGIKTSSPNSKRVSPPHREFTSSPGRRNNRRLVLQSIPSFPSLNQNVNE